MGVGLDEYGLFASKDEKAPGDNGLGSGNLGDTGQRPDAVTVRGREGSTSLLGYPLITTQSVSFGIDNVPGDATVSNTNPLPGSVTTTLTTNRLAAKRSVQIILNPSNAAVNPNGLSVAFDTNFDGTFETTIIDIPNLLAVNGPLIPPSFKFGFASSTGQADNAHELQNLVVETINTPTIAADVSTIKTGPQFVKPSSSISYTITTTNRGPSPAQMSWFKTKYPRNCLWQAEELRF